MNRVYILMGMLWKLNCTSTIYQTSLCPHHSQGLYEAMEFVLRERMHTHNTHKDLMDKEAGTGCVCTMPLPFDTRTLAQTQTHTHKHAHTCTHKHAHTQTNTHTRTHTHSHTKTSKSLMWTKEVVLEVRALCLQSFKSQLLYYPHWYFILNISYILKFLLFILNILNLNLI